MALFPENSEGTARAAGLEESRAETETPEPPIENWLRLKKPFVRTARIKGWVNVTSVSLTASRFRHGLSEPSFEARLTETGVLTGEECSLVELRASVSSLWVGDDFAGIVEAGQAAPD